MPALQNIRYVRADNTNEVVIPAKSGESHRILEIFIDSPANNSYFDVIIGTKPVARIPVKYNDCLFVAGYTGSVRNQSIIALLKELFGEEFDFVADEDEDITLKFSATQGTIHVFYEVSEAGIDKTRLGRSQCDDYMLFAIATHTKEINASGNYEFDKAITPTGFPDIINEFIVPTGRKFVLKAMAAGVTASGDTKPTAMHLYDETFEFFDPEDHQGISIEPNKNMLTVDIKTFDIYRVDDYEIMPGHKITWTFDAVYDGTNTLAAESIYGILIGLYTKP